MVMIHDSKLISYQVDLEKMAIEFLVECEQHEKGKDRI